MSICIAKIIHLDLLKRPTIWNGRSTKLLDLSASTFRYMDEHASADTHPFSKFRSDRRIDGNKMLWQSYFISRKSMTKHSKQSSKIYMDSEHGSISIHEIVVAEVFPSTPEHSYCR